ncbi:nucleotidyltransferase domain-containing protein [Methyloterricola oryzae]|uniref:nucleotidyltransferase domain-containing protein n=1 Tax=Methyloterricola oryzae TaxID=1495050 RepID=UPI0005EBCCCC
MRLTLHERHAISDAIVEADKRAVINLYGSRVDDNAKAGRIDLLVLSSGIDLMRKLDILARLHRELGERKIDLTIYPEADRSFTRIAISSGVCL